MHVFQRALDEPARACSVCDEFCYAPLEFPIQDVCIEPGVKPSTFVRSLHNYCRAPTGAVPAAHNSTAVGSAAGAAAGAAAAGAGGAAADVDGASALSDDEGAGDREDADEPPGASNRSALARRKKYPPGERWLLPPDAPPLNPTLRAQYDVTAALSPADREAHPVASEQLGKLLMSPRGLRSAPGPNGDVELVLSVCHPCHKALARDELPIPAISNSNCIGYLPSIFDDTSAGEFALLRFAYRCGGKLVTLDGGQGHTSFEGHMHFLFRDVGVVTQMLPLNPSECDFRVVFTGPKVTQNASSLAARYLRVRRDRVCLLLDWFRQHNQIMQRGLGVAHRAAEEGSRHLQACTFLRKGSQPCPSMGFLSSGSATRRVRPAVGGPRTPPRPLSPHPSWAPECYQRASPNHTWFRWKCGATNHTWFRWKCAATASCDPTLVRLFFVA